MFLVRFLHKFTSGTKKIASLIVYDYEIFLTKSPIMNNEI